MTISPIERRGLQEIVAFSVSTVMTGLITIVSIMKTGTVDTSLLTLYGTMATTLIVRATKSAADRAAISDIRNGEGK